MYRMTWFTAALLAVVFISCSPAPTDSAGTETVAPALSPKQVAAEFLDARREGDLDAMAEHMTAAASKFLLADSGFSLSNDAPDLTYTLRDATIEGDIATVEAEVIETPGEAPQDTALKMRQEESAWRVYAIAIEADGMSMTLDFEKLENMMTSVVEGLGESMKEGFEQAAADWQKGGSDEEIAAERARFEALAPVSGETLTAAYINETAVSDVPAIQALETLAAHLDLTVWPGDHVDALSQTVSVDVADVSCLEAIERVSAEVGLYPVYPDPSRIDHGIAMAMVNALAEGIETMLTGDEGALTIDGVDLQAETTKAQAETEAIPDNAITFLEGPRPYPVQFHGPFLITVDEIEENVPHATGALPLRVRGYGFPPGMLAVLNGMNEPITIDAVTNATGDSLREDDDVQYIGGTQVVGTAYADVTNISLVRLLRDVEEIEAVSGTQHLRRPTAVETIEFTAIKEGLSEESGDLRVTIESVGKSTAFKITGAEERLSELQVYFAANDANGNPLGKTYEYYSHWNGDTMQANVQTPELPGTVTLKLVDTAAIDYPFELARIPLKRFVDQPAELTPLDYGDHELPVSITFDSFGDRSNPDFPKVNLTIANHANKHATGIFAQFHYFDGAGNAIDDFPHSIMGDFDQELGEFIAAHAGKTVSRETTAFQMPQNTKRVEVRVDRLEFIDGTEWTAPE